MTLMRQTEWLSADGRFAARSDESVINSILRQCQASGSQETGGILVGYYTADHDCAVITEASSASPDSQSGPIWFYRGVSGLSQWLQCLWSRRRREYYLGEWHFHPGGPNVMSSCDAEQIARNAH